MEDESESSIHNLGNAPEPPPGRPTYPASYSLKSQRSRAKSEEIKSSPKSFHQSLRITNSNNTGRLRLGSIDSLPFHNAGFVDSPSNSSGSARHSLRSTFRVRSRTQSEDLSTNHQRHQHHYRSSLPPGEHLSDLLEGSETISNGLDQSETIPASFSDIDLARISRSQSDDSDIIIKQTASKGSESARSKSSASVRSTHSSLVAWNEVSEEGDESSSTDSQHVASKCYEKYIPSGHRVATCMVTWCPCFWCFKKEQIHLTDRQILGRLNIINSFFALGQIGYCLFVLIIRFSPIVADRNGVQVAPIVAQTSKASEASYMWNYLPYCPYIMGALGLLNLTANTLVVKSIRYMNTFALIGFLWLLVLEIPVYIYCIIEYAASHSYYFTYITQFWRSPQVAWFRESFCEPESTANTLCAAPILRNTTAWCLSKYNATNCAEIRDDAQQRTSSFLYLVNYANFAFNLFAIVPIIVSINILLRMVTKPLFYKTSHRGLPLCLLIFAVVAAAVSIIHVKQSPIPKLDDFQVFGTNNTAWLGPLFACSASIFLCCSFLSLIVSRKRILNVTDKRGVRLAIVAYIVLVSMNILVLSTLVIGSIAQGIVTYFEDINETTRGRIACAMFPSRCTGCGASSGAHQCLELTSDDMSIILNSEFRQSAVVAAMLLWYSCVTLRIGFIFRSHIASYLIDYV